MQQHKVVRAKIENMVTIVTIDNHGQYPPLGILNIAPAPISTGTALKGGGVQRTRQRVEGCASNYTT